MENDRPQPTRGNNNLAIANLEWRLGRLESDVKDNRQRQDEGIASNRRDIEDLKTKGFEDRRDIEGNLQTALRRIDTLALKVGFIGIVGGLLGSAILEFIVQRLSK